MNEQHGYEQLDNGALASNLFFGHSKWDVLNVTDDVLDPPSSLYLSKPKKHF
jgi:hypothetical protein